MRKRTKDRHLPACVYIKHGAYYWVKGGKWTRLGSDLSVALQRYAELTTANKGMDELLDATLADAASRVKVSTLKQYKKAVVRIKKVFVEFSPAEVRPEHIYQYMDTLTASQANLHRAVLKLAFTRAVLSGKALTNPVDPVPRRKENKRDRYITDTEFAEIKKHASPVLRCIMDLAYLTGQRIGDILSISLSDISAEGVAFKQQKSGTRLLIELVPDLAEAVQRARRLHPRQVTPTYLLGLRNGNKRSSGGVRDAWSRACIKAKVSDANIHDIRAKAITDAKKQGLNATELAGHSTEQQTVRYIRGREVIVARGPSIRQVSN